MEISEEEEGEEDVEEVENVDERTDRRAEKILLGEEVSSSSEEEEQGKMDVEGKERNYHTDTDSDLVSRIVTFYASIPHFFNSTSFFLFWFISITVWLCFCLILLVPCRDRE